VRHQIWIDWISWSPTPNTDISRIPEVVQAQQRLNRHIRHYPSAAINKALDDAEDIINYWADRNSWGEEIRQDRYNRMWGAAEWQWDVGPANSARSIATFPEIVALASIILSSSWRREVALSVGFYGAKRHFIGKLGRRLNIERFDPGGAWDHLLTWIDNRQREYARYCRARKLLVGDPDGLAELRPLPQPASQRLVDRATTLGP
jgi:hypothetical protein